MPTKKCPVCGVPVKLENLERHVRNQHPRADVDIREALTEEEVQAATQARASARPPVTGRGMRLVALAAVIIALLLVLVILNPFGNVGPQVGQVAPDFTLNDTSSSPFTLSSYRGTVVLLEFMDVDCEFCVQEAPVLASVFGTHAPLGVRFVSVDINFLGQADTVDRILAFKQQHGTNWVYVLDSGAAQNAYRVSSTPTTFILDRSGVITKIFVGLAQGGADEYRTALNAALGA